MLHGQIPYLDMFDHKGLTLYIIYLLGIVVGCGDPSGVWLLTIISALIGLYFNYKIGYLLTSSEEASFFSTLLMLFLLGNFVNMAGLKEMFALPFIFVSLYLFLQHIKKRSSKTYRYMVIVGICGGCVLLITPTLAILWLVIGIWVLVDMIRNRSGEAPIKTLMCIFIGVTISVVPQLIWLYANGAFDAFVECYLLYNLGYSAEGLTSIQWLYQNMRLLEMIITNSGVVFAELVLLLTYLRNKSTNNQIRDICVFAILCYVITVLLTCLTGHGYDHYMAVTLPSLSIPFAFGIHYLHQTVSKTTQKNWQQFSILLMCVGLIGISGIGIGALYGVANNFPLGDSISSTESTTLSDEKIMINIINGYCDDGDFIQVFSNRDYLYLETNTFAASRFNYLPGGFEMYENEIHASLIEHVPKIIVEDKTREIGVKTPEIMNYIQENYTNIMETEKYNLYLKEVNI